MPLQDSHSDAIATRDTHVLAGLDTRFGGPTSALLGLVEAQAKAGTAVSILATSYRPARSIPEIDRIRDAGGIVESIPHTRGISGNIRGLNDRIKSAVSQADVVHVHGLWNVEQHLAALACQGQHRPYIIRPCGMLAPWSSSRTTLPTPEPRISSQRST